MRLFAAANPVRVMASGAIDVNHKDEVYDGKVTFSFPIFLVSVKLLDTYDVGKGSSPYLIYQRSR